MVIFSLFVFGYWGFYFRCDIWERIGNLIVILEICVVYILRL